MRIKVGDHVEYWHGLAGTRIREGTVKRIELQVGVAPDVGVLPAALVEEIDLDADHQGAFIDLAEGSWTYAGRLIAVNGQRV